jgi:hypothetical protein
MIFSCCPFLGRYICCCSWSPPYPLGARYRVCVSCSSPHDKPQQRPHRPHLLGVLLRIDPTRFNRVIGQLTSVGEALRGRGALVDGVEEVPNIDVYSVDSLRFRLLISLSSST